MDLGGVARRPIPTWRSTAPDSGRLDPTSHWLQSLFEQVKANPQRIVFAEGEEEAPSAPPWCSATTATARRC